MSDLSYASHAKKNHTVILENRGILTLSGVTKVGCFDENTVVLYTDYGELTVTGSNLHMGKISVETGDVEVTGTVKSVSYREGGPGKESLFKRIFK